MKRVVFIIPSFTGGGAERVIITFLKYINRNQIEPILIVQNDEGPLRNLVPPDVKVFNLEVIRFRSGVYKLIQIIRNLQPTAIISTFSHINVTLLAFKLFIPRSTKIIIREANTPSKSLKSTHSPKFFNFICRRYYPRADAVLCSSNLIANEINREFRVPLSKIVRINNPVDIEAIRRSIDKPYHDKNFKRYFIAAGRLTFQKGFDRLLDDFSNTPPKFGLIILGEGSERKLLERQIEKLGLESRVLLKGFISKPWPLYSGAEAFLLPSRWEGMPNAALEALACGTPVIATPESGGMAEICKIAPEKAITIATSGKPFIKAIITVSENFTPSSPSSLLPSNWEVKEVTRQLENLIFT